MRQQADKATTLLVAIKVLAAQSRNSYGSRRITKSLQRQGYPVGRFRARRLTRKADVVCLQRLRYVITTQSKPGLPAAENQLKRQFDIDIPNGSGQLMLPIFLHKRADFTWP